MKDDEYVWRMIASRRSSWAFISKPRHDMPICAFASAIQLGISAKQVVLVESKAPLGGEVAREPRPLRHALAKRSEQWVRAGMPRHRARKRIVQPLEHLEHREVYV